VTHCRCDPEVVSMHLFNVYIGNNGCICFVAKHNTQNTITVKISVGFFGFRVQEVGRLYLSNFNFPKKEMTYAIAIVNKKSREPHCAFENELVPLNGRIM